MTTMTKYAVQFFALCLMALVVIPAAHAHRVGIPLTTIEWNTRSDTWEITHRLDMHDFDPVLTEDFSPSRLYETAGGLAHIDTYVRRHFAITGETELTYIGAEQDGDFVWVYYEMQAIDQTLLIRNDLLMGEGATTSALVNIAGAEGLASLVFEEGDSAKPAQIQRPG